MGILEGKRILVTGVLTESSIAFSAARLAQEQGAEVILSSFGRQMKITSIIAERLPKPAEVIELDATNEDDLAALPERLGGNIDGIVHAIAFAPKDALGGVFLDTPWESVSNALHVSAYSLKAIAVAAQPVLNKGASIVGLTFDATVAWPAYDWMGVSKAALESTSRYLARYLGEHDIRVNLISAGRSRPPQRSPSPASRRSKTCGVTAHRSAGTRATRNRQAAASWLCCPTGSPRPPAR